MHYTDLPKIRIKLIDFEVSHIIPENATQIWLEEFEDEKFSLPGNIYYEPWNTRYVLTYIIPNDVKVTVEFTKRHT